MAITITITGDHVIDYNWLRLPITPTLLEVLEIIINVADDTMFDEGTTYEEAERDHDRRFLAIMERFINKNIKLNPEKLKFKMTELFCST